MGRLSDISIILVPLREKQLKLSNLITLNLRKQTKHLILVALLLIFRMIKVYFSPLGFGYRIPVYLMLTSTFV